MIKMSESKLTDLITACRELSKEWEWWENNNRVEDVVKAIRDYDNK